MEVTTYEAFPTLLYELNFTSDLVDASRKELDTFRDIGLPSVAYGYYTSYNNPWRLNVGPATSEITDTIQNTISRHIGKQYVIDNSWVNYMPKGTTHSMHRHGDDFMKSVIIYYDDIGETHFFDPRVQIYNEDAEKISAKKGKCIVFPSWVMHEVPQHYEDVDRVSISLNLCQAFRKGGVE
jgi:hypothetical protein